MDTVSMEVPDPPADKVTLLVLNSAVGPPTTMGEMVKESDKMPEKPLLLRVMLEVTDVPATRLRLIGFAEMVKSTTLTVTAAEWTKDPMVPFTVTTYAPGAVVLPALINRVAEPVPPVVSVMVAGLNVAVRP